MQRSFQTLIDKYPFFKDFLTDEKRLAIFKKSLLPKMVDHHEKIMRKMLSVKAENFSQKRALEESEVAAVRSFVFSNAVLDSTFIEPLLEDEFFQGFTRQKRTNLLKCLQHHLFDFLEKEKVIFRSELRTEMGDSFIFC